MLRLSALSGSNKGVDHLSAPSTQSIAGHLQLSQPHQQLLLVQTPHFALTVADALLVPTSRPRSTSQWCCCDGASFYGVGEQSQSWTPFFSFAPTTTARTTAVLPVASRCYSCFVATESAATTSRIEVQ